MLKPEESQGMPVVLLAGGLGTRLREETEFRPKPMVEIGGRPILWHIMKYFSGFGHNEFIICLGYKGDYIRDYFLNYHTRNISLSLNLSSNEKPTFFDSHDENWTVSLIDTGIESLTAERLLRVKDYVGDRTFMMTYGDGLADIDLDALINFHRTHSGRATLSAVHPTSRFGVLDINNDGLVSSFHEKPVVDDWINGGYFVLEPQIFQHLESGGAFEDRPLKKLSQEKTLFAYEHTGFWQPMDTYREYLELNQMWSEDRAPWKTWA